MIGASLRGERSEYRPTKRSDTKYRPEASERPKDLVVPSRTASHLLAAVAHSSSTRNDVSYSLILSGKCHPAWNMAVDEALLRCAQKEAIPQLIMRIYGWDRPSLSIGYFQSFDAAEAICRDEVVSRHIVRRSTGGGMVRHDTDVTYALIYPEGFLSAERQKTPRRSSPDYHFIHGLIKKAAERVGWKGLEELAPASGHKGRIIECFAQPSPFDLMCGGEKIAGAAQKRSRGWILHQGTIQWTQRYDEQLQKTMVLAVVDVFSEHFQISLPSRALKPSEQALASDLCAERYGVRSWNEKF